MTAATALPSPYTRSTDIAAARLDVQQLVCDLPGGNPDEQGFEHPWEIRAFGLAVAAHRRLGFDWAEFQSALIASIRSWELTAGPGQEPWSYYEHWVTALEAVLTKAGVLGVADLDAATRDVLALPPNRNHHAAHTEPIAIDPASAEPRLTPKETP